MAVGEAAIRSEKPEAHTGAVAIIGMDGRVGQAENLEQFWELLAQEKEGLREIPAQRRRDIETYLKAHGAWRPDEKRSYLRSTYLEDISLFDPGFFGISRQEANYMDPNQRIFLETAWKSLEDAGYGGSDIRGTDTGLFVGYTSDFGEDYRHMISRLHPDAPEVSVAGNVKSVIASRLAYHLDLRGPALLVDTACSSGLMAVYLASRAIRSGECTMAIAGAVNLDLLPFVDKGTGFGIKDIQDIQSADSHTRTFDDKCDGTTTAEGSFAFVLKSLDDALRDGDCIRAIIRGGATNQDGASNGITAPNTRAQEDLIVRALEDARVSAEDLSYIEAHGTATRLGDPIEINGIQSALRHFTDKKQFCAIGAVKSNIGHLDNAAGLGGLAKVVMAMEKKVLPATLNFSVPNRNISFVESPVYVNDRTVPWTDDPEQVVQAGINSFGLSGTNCHLVLESARARHVRSREEEVCERLLLPLSAKTPEALKTLAKAYQVRLADPNVDLVDAVFTASRGRMHHQIRLAVLFETRDQLCAALGRFASLGKDALPDIVLRYGAHRLIENDTNRRRPTDLTNLERERLEAEAQSLVNGCDGRLSPDVLERWAELYVAGAELPWDYLTKGLETHRIPLPTYPFQGVRCWVEPKVTIGETASLGSHPLLGDSEVKTIGHTLIRKQFRPEQHWELSDHRIRGTSVLPGTAFIEMIAAYAERSNIKTGGLRLTNILFLQPFTVTDGAAKELHMLVQDEGKRKHFKFASCSSDGDWVIHAEAFSEDTADREAGTDLDVDLTALQERLNDRVPVDTADDLIRGIHLGGRWNESVIGCWKAEETEEFLVELSLPNKYRGHDAVYHLHPALLDQAVNAANHLMDEKELYLPLSYGELRVYKPLPPRLFAHLQKVDRTARPEDRQAGAPVHRFNMALYDAAGGLILEIRDYCIKSTSEAWGEREAGEAYGYKQVFRPYKLPSERELPSGAVLVAGKRTASFDALVATLSDQGRRVIEIAHEGQDWGQALHCLDGEELALAVFTWAPHSSQSETFDLRESETDEAVLQGFKFLQAWSKAKYKAKAGLVALTFNSCVVKESDRDLHPSQAALGGLWRVSRLEFATLHMRCLDCDRATPMASVLRELAAQDRPDFLAYRNGQAYEHALAANPILPHKSSWAPQNDGVYVVTGGTGDLGTEVATFLARKGVRRVVLIGHRPLPPSEAWNDQLTTTDDAELRRKLGTWIELEQSLDAFEVRSAGLENYEEVAALLSELRSKYGRISGIFHLAGKAGDGFLFHKQEEVFRDVYAPKANGALNLHLASLQERPDVFILFSSISSIVLSPGQTDYTSANMFLDSLAELRRRMGLPALSLQWPAWRETGMAYRMGAVNEEEAFAPVNTSEALELLERALCPSQSLPPVLMPGRMQPTFSPAKEKRIGEVDVAASADDKRQQVTILGMSDPDEVDRAVATIWMKTLLVAEVDADEPFSNLGGNSLLTTQMLKEYEQIYPGLMDIADLFTYTTLREQADYLRSKIATPERTAEEAAEVHLLDMGDDADIDDILERVSRGELSVEESSTRIFLQRGRDEQWNK
ncbi:type I polyketide synthase [Numidum massiliense]|uniref:type I polyketide synthase n=1 Tax=Numidum massiliense TaxID=1522315 RepID=UPI0021C37E56|nr:type I polyketide synthase [Numidum massiliense]